MAQHILETISLNKDEVANTISHMPEKFSAIDLMEQIFLEKDITQGLADIETGNVISNDDMKKMIASWRK